MISFTRQLGAEAGVQLNPTLDQSQGFASDNVGEQSFGCVARLVRGPIDRAFTVSKSNVLQVTGLPESASRNDLNRGHIQLIEALNKGAKNAVVSRVVGANASNQWILVKQQAVVTDNFPLEFELSDTLSGKSFLFALKHKGCYSDGIKIAISAKEVRDETNEQLASSEIVLKVLDKANTPIFQTLCSIDKNNTDDSGLPNHLESIIANYSYDDFECVLAENAEIQPQCKAYGLDDNGVQREQISELLFPFTEGTMTVVSASRYTEAVEKLKQADAEFVYLSTLGNGSTALIGQLAELANEHNILLNVDVPNHMTPSQAINWKKGTGITSHLVTFLWHPVECLDPTGVSGRVNLETGAYRTALSCLRNASRNNMGFARKNYVIAGADYPVQRSGMKQLYKPSQDEMSDLAKAGITPVIYQSFASGFGGFIFADAITASGKVSSFLNLVNSVEIATTIERETAKMARESFMFGPMSEAIRQAERMLSQYLEDAQSSGWLVPTDELGGFGYAFTVKANTQRPNDVMDVTLTLRVEGCVRQVYITNTLVR